MHAKVLYGEMRWQESWSRWHTWLVGRLTSSVIKKSYSGNELYSLISEDYFDELYQKHVHKEPDTALKFIAEYFGEAVDELGSNNIAISLIRDVVAQFFEAQQQAYFIMIVAPHTHWDVNRPIIYSNDDTLRRYLVGLQHIDASAEYRAVSFVFSEMEILPYEWIDRSIKIDPDELSYAYEAVGEIFKSTDCSQWPFGISIDFRFKQSLFDCCKNTIESSTLNENILKITEACEDDQYLVQVGWSANTISPYKGLSNNGYRVLNNLQDQLDTIEQSSDKIKFVDELERTWKSLRVC